MTWLEHHIISERYASDAEAAILRGEHSESLRLYIMAAKAEEQALGDLPPDKARTYGITAVSAAALYFKASQWDKARILAYRCLGSGHLPKFASQQLEDLLGSIKREQAEIGSDTSQMIISLKGGEILHGGAPLDLVISKAEKIKTDLQNH